MSLFEEGSLLRIFIGESARYEGHVLYEWLVLQARKQGLAGATVLRGRMGFGANSVIHTSKILRLSEDLPIIVELVDTREKLKAYLAEVNSAIREGLATLEKADVRFYRGARDQRKDVS